MNTNRALVEKESQRERIFSSSRRDERAVGRHNELKMRELCAQPAGNLSLPDRMQVNIQFVDQNDAFLKQWIVAIRKCLRATATRGRLPERGRCGIHH